MSLALAEAGWDGRLMPEPNADYLALVDTNMGYNKVDAVLERSVHYDVTWPDGEDQPGLATATINYLHPVSLPDHVCDLTPRYDAPEYDDMTRRCYFDYVRLHVPAGSELVSIEGVDPESISAERGERETDVLAGYFQLLPGYQHNVIFTYRLPPHITPDNYALVIQRQSGSKPLPVTASVAGHTLDMEVAQDRFIWTPE
ncbi:MAG: hypothetical protein HC802_04155 [Caldilineaceae bacterium]|nr:hypothetical protein [Caldilineaceae bacterium]